MSAFPSSIPKLCNKIGQRLTTGLTKIRDAEVIWVGAYLKNSVEMNFNARRNCQIDPDRFCFITSLTTICLSPGNVESAGSVHLLYSFPW